MDQPNLISRRMLVAGGCALGILGAGRADAAPFVSQRIAVTVRGTGPDVLLIPGLASGPGIWNGTVAAVPGYRYHLVQVRGFAGLAPGANKSGPLVTPLVAELARYIAEAGLTRPMVVGHSMGGTLAMMLGLRSVVRRIMVVDMLPDGAGMVGGTASGMGYLAEQLSQYFTATKAGRQMFADLLAQAPGAQGSDPDVIATSLRELAQTDLAPQLARLRAPLQVVYALPTDPRQREAQIARYRSGYAAAKAAKLVPITRSGHMVMADQPVKFATALRGFLAGG